MSNRCALQLCERASAGTSICLPSTGRVCNMSAGQSNDNLLLQLYKTLSVMHTLQAEAGIHCVGGGN